MTTRSVELTQQELKVLLSYNEETGVFTWLKHRRPSLVGTAAGWPTDGYLKIDIKRKKYFAHRLAWFYVHGKWPVDCVDHIDGDRSNNRISNLREATIQENSRNKECRGFAFNRRRIERPYTVRIGKNGKYLYIGAFRTVAEAREAYKAGSIAHYGKFSVFRRHSERAK